MRVKKRHPRKNIVVRDAHRSIVFLSPTVAGYQHDYTRFKECDFPDPLPQEVCGWGDLGFQGMATAYPYLNVVMPDQKPRGGELTDEQKALNVLKASMRGGVEHAIGGLQRLHCMA